MADLIWRLRLWKNTKGQDLIALKIREIAEEHDVPIVEDKPLARSLFDAVEVDQMIPPEFYQATKRIHNTLQGADQPFTPTMRESYLEASRQASRTLDLGADLVMIHDPQPAPLIEARQPGGRWLWRCHIDLSTPQRSTWSFLEPLVRRYDGAVFHLPA